MLTYVFFISVARELLNNNCHLFVSKTPWLLSHSDLLTGYVSCDAKLDRLLDGKR